MATITRSAILRAAAEQLDDGQSVSLDSAARAVGLTKPGVMHHFPTKESLMLALVDSVLDHWELELTARLAVPVAEATAVQRTLAYLDWSLSGDFCESDLVAMSDPRLRRPMTRRWVERMTPWLVLPHDLDPALRARLIAVRLLADGAWLADATDFFPPNASERDHVRSLAHDLLKG